MAIDGVGGGTHHQRSQSEGGKRWGLCPFWQSNLASSSSSSTQQLHNYNNDNNNIVNNFGNNYRGGGFGGGSENQGQRGGGKSSGHNTVSSVARAILPARRRLRLDPNSHLYFPFEPGTQVRSAIRIKNASKSHVAFKFQTTAPKSCYMRPPGGILAPGESIIATVFKFVEQPENNEKLLALKTKVKFKIVSLKVKEGTEYVPELFDEQREHVTVERILRVVFLDAERQSPAMEKLKRQLAEAEAALEAQKKPSASADNGPTVVGEGLVIDEWKERRVKYLARQQVEAIDTL
ncbi:Vesicle-associated protein 4-2-like protein [Drosera capensis]